MNSVFKRMDDHLIFLRGIIFFQEIMGCAVLLYLRQNILKINFDAHIHVKIKYI